jgi:hypothetical protein
MVLPCPDDDATMDNDVSCLCSDASGGKALDGSDRFQLADPGEAASYCIIGVHAGIEDAIVEITLHLKYSRDVRGNECLRGACGIGWRREA